MNNNDDFLDVAAYLQSKIKKNAEDSRDLIGDYSEIDEKYSEIEDELDALSDSAEKLATALGIDASLLQEDIPAGHPDIKHSSSDFTVKLPEGFDYASAFDELVKKAHEAGFVDIKPWDLLSERELQQIEAYEDSVNKRFAEETALSDKDISVLIISTAIRIFYFYLLRIFTALKENADSTASPVASQTVCDMPKADTPVIDAAQNVDIDGINETESAKQAFSFLENGIEGLKPIKSEKEILNGILPFDLPDNEFFQRKDILAYHPVIGWFVGIVNILTDTVTTSSLESFAVIKSMFGDMPQLKKEKNLAVILPVIFDWTTSKDSLLAAVVREAGALKLTTAPIEDVSAMLKENMIAEERSADMLNKADSISRALPLDLSSLDITGLFRDTAVTAFFNKLVTAIHAVRYDPKEDGDIMKYTVRTNKIILISSAVAASVNSIPAILAEDITKADITGIIMSIISMVNSTKFWLNAKADYLASEYKKRLDKEFREIEEFFNGGNG